MVRIDSDIVIGHLHQRVDKHPEGVDERSRANRRHLLGGESAIEIPKLGAPVVIDTVLCGLLSRLGQSARDAHENVVLPEIAS